MSVPRISVAWIAILFILAGVAFLGYHIYEVANMPQVNGMGDEKLVKTTVVPQNAPVETQVLKKEDLGSVSQQLDYEVQPVPVPHVVGQTEEDLRRTRPINDTPPEVQYAEPEAQDPLEGTVHSESEFGNTLRHPEQIIELHPPLGTMRVPPAGLGGQNTAMGINEGVPYSPEMAQNGGEFMQGIFAFDGSDGSGGIGFSSI
jgi:hypothetical protein